MWSITITALLGRLGCLSSASRLYQERTAEMEKFQAEVEALGAGNVSEEDMESLNMLQLEIDVIKERRDAQAALMEKYAP